MLKVEFDCPNNKVYYYSDSQIVLYWLTKSPESLATYQGNRVRQILETPGTWRYVATNENPADLLSRGCKVLRLMNPQWLQGPEWLSQDSTRWPEQPPIHPPINEDDALVSFVVLADVVPTGIDLSSNGHD